jgi:hypothetical protein
MVRTEGNPSSSDAAPYLRGSARTEISYRRVHCECPICTSQSRNWKLELRPASTGCHKQEFTFTHRSGFELLCVSMSRQPILLVAERVDGRSNPYRVLEEWLVGSVHSPSPCHEMSDSTWHCGLTLAGGDLAEIVRNPEHNERARFGQVPSGVLGRDSRARERRIEEPRRCRRFVCPMMAQRRPRHFSHDKFARDDRRAMIVAQQTERLDLSLARCGHAKRHIQTSAWVAFLVCPQGPSRAVRA